MSEVSSLPPREDAPAPGEILSLALLAGDLIARETTWIRRRVETISFVDGTRARISTSIDFALPDLRGFLVEEGAVIPIPLAMPLKDFMRDFDLADESGRALPVLTRDENATLSAELLTSLGEREVLKNGQGPLDPIVERQLRDVVGARYGPKDFPDEEERRIRARAALIAFASSAQLPSPGMEFQQAASIWADDQLRGLIRELADRFILFTLLPAVTAKRRVLKMSREVLIGPKVARGALNSERRERAPGGGNRWDAFLQSAAIRPFEAAFTTRALYGASSYHVEIEVPAELVFSYVELGQVIVRDKHAVLTPLARESRVHRAHLHSSGTARPASASSSDPDDREVGYISLRVRLRTGTLWPPAVISSVTSAILLSGMVLHLTGRPARPEAAAPLLVAVPAVFAAYLLPGEHPLARRMFRWLRILVLVEALIAFAAAASLAVDLSGGSTLVLWALLAGGSLVCNFFVGLAVLMAWRDTGARGRKHYPESNGHY